MKIKYKISNILENRMAILAFLKQKTRLKYNSIINIYAYPLSIRSKVASSDMNIFYNKIGFKLYILSDSCIAIITENDNIEKLFLLEDAHPQKYYFKNYTEFSFMEFLKINKLIE